MQLRGPGPAEQGATLDYINKQTPESMLFWWCPWLAQVLGYDPARPTRLTGAASVFLLFRQGKHAAAFLGQFAWHHTISTQSWNRLETKLNESLLGSEHVSVFLKQTFSRYKFTVFSWKTLFETVLQKVQQFHRRTNLGSSKRSIHTKVLIQTISFLKIFLTFHMFLKNPFL